MVVSRQIKCLLALGSLAACALASPTAQHRLADDDDDDTPLPLVIWHGLGDTFAADGIRSVGELAEAANPGTLVYFARIDENPNSDRSASWFGNVTEQVAKVCDDIAAHPILSTAPAIDALGFSQGGQFLRAYVERCNAPPVRSLVTFGSQHNGISSFRGCSPTDWLCRGAMALLRGNTWSPYVQNRLVPAQYFRDPETAAEYEKYLEHSNFLADINNERAEKNMAYRANLANLTNFVMYMFADDTTVVPKETAWFEEVNGTESIPLRARRLYSEDWLGLRELDRRGGLHFRTTPGDHMQLSEGTLSQTFKEFFGPYKKTFSSPEHAPGDDEL